MRAKELIRRLQKIVNKHGNPEVLFDTEAMCFDVHLVGIKSMYFLPEKMSGDKDMVTLHFDWYKEPFHYNRSKK